MTAGGIVGEFLSLKEETDADLLAMQCGDFYEFFADDAETVGEELDLRISEKSSHGSTYPMAGVPVDDLTPYLKALVERGYRVAVADQYETDGGHAREITRVVTPGTLLETTDADAQYLASVVRVDDGYGLAFTDVTTGRFLVTSVEGEGATERAATELYRYDPVEVLPGPECRDDDAFLERVRDRIDASLTPFDPNAFAPGAASHRAREQFGEETLDSLGFDADALEVRAAGAALAYVEETGAGVLRSMTRLTPYRDADRVTLDATTQRNLELTETMTGAGASLCETIDHTVTGAGCRLLKEWLRRPRRSLDVLERRQECVAALAESALAREEIRDALGEAYDLERLSSRAAHGSADARALLRVRDTLALLPDVAETIANDSRLSSSPLAAIVDRPDRERVARLREDLADALAEDPPKTLREGGLIRYGYDADLDELVDRHEEALEWIDGLADREKRRHGLAHVTVDRNRTDGYYIQVGKSEADDVPEAYEQVKTLKNSVRFTTDALAEREREILRIEEERGELEYELFEALRERVAERATILQDVGRALAEIDALASLATHAVANRWARPALSRSDRLEIERGRHPVVEQTTEFVPNDARLDDKRAFLLVTGPNMSGKSTYMRQVALIVLLAQVGSFVPAEEAHVGLVDGIFTRVGALDELSGGRSTFMVEMQELSNILHAATDDSLVILDEVGRGTATYDGISIAWAATEYLHYGDIAGPQNRRRESPSGPKVLFATHYHELTALGDRLSGVHNVHMAAEERDGDVTFLRTIKDGPADRSYGIHVAELAGVPDPVVDRARDVLDRLRNDKAIDVKEGAGGTQQVVFDLGSGQFRGAASADGGDKEPLDPATESVLEELRDTDVNDTPPVELMAKVQEWQDRLQEE